jgi:8-oxo-dGTP pyrophosphatase MutT (NUDIX family)
MPREVRERTLALIRGEFDPPPVRDATTVVLVPEGAPLRTYLMRRAMTMAFAPGMWVFPGGRVDARDQEVPIVGEVSSDRMTAPSLDVARGLVAGAARELFEETSILLAVDESGAVPREGPHWEADRAAVASGEVPFAHFLRDRGLRIDASALCMWTHWVTPEMETRRYDVRFFVARVPVGQQVRDVSGEADQTGWFTAQQALQSYGRGSMPMLPPTVATLADIAALGDATDVLDVAPTREIRPLMPRPRLVEGDQLAWDVVDVRDNSIVLSMAQEPAGSEVEGMS